ATLRDLDSRTGRVGRAQPFGTGAREGFHQPTGRAVPSALRHRLVHHPRQCIFIGTTNSDTWLKDETGGRRLWPVKCNAINRDTLKNDRDQLWAEALLRYREGVRWWLEGEEVIKEAIEEQRGRYAADVWQEKVGKFAQEEADQQVSITGGKRDTRGQGS